MELVSAYLYNSSPIPTINISARTFHNLKRNGWYKDMRASAKFEILNKRFKINDEWYRVIVRFSKKENVYELDMPMPFVVAKTTTQDEVVFKDTKVFHGRKMGNTIGYLEHGVPNKLIDNVIYDLKQNIEYTDKELGERVSKNLEVEWEF